MANPELLISIPKRGLRIIPPAITQRNMELARQGTIVQWPREEKIRLREIINSPIMAKRFPRKDIGREFMTCEVDENRRLELLEMTEELTKVIVNAWKSINQDEEIAILLFGSVAKGLVKRADHPDPSNIDLAVIGNITIDEKNDLFDKIRPNRSGIQQRILSNVPFLNSPETNPGNAGVMIQDLEVVRKGGYDSARNYIRGSAVAIYDPSGIWAGIEQETLSYLASKDKKLKTV